jgi:type VI secretion system protein VasG
VAEISRGALFGKLNEVSYRAIESATIFCKMRANPYVEVLHWLHQILQLQDSDLHRIIKAFELNPSRLASDLTAALDGLPRRAGTMTDFSAHLEDLVERAWVYGTLLFGESQIRTGHLIVALLKAPSLRNVLPAISGEFKKIKAETLSDDFAKLLGDSPEAHMAARDGSTIKGGAEAGSGGDGAAPALMGKQDALNKYTVDLTAKARAGEIDPVVGRDNEIRQIVDVLMRRRQNNPILTGEAGVGKTAVVEGFAQRIVAKDVPPALLDVTLRTLDVGLLQAGASMKGEFENRLRGVIDEVHASPTPIILFIDEAHTLIGAGGQAGTGDAANLLKPELARGTLRTIAATTWSEYKKYFEKDPALTRRFQVVQIDEPDEAKALLMMRGLSGKMEKHHKVQVLDEALDAAVKYAHRYIPARQLPDKSVSLLDTASARVAISQHATPPELESCNRTIEALKVELDILGREAAIGRNVAERQNRATQTLAEQQALAARLEARWREEKELALSILALRAKLSVPPPAAPEAESADNASRDRKPRAEAPLALDPAERTKLLADLRQREDALGKLQGETPLVLTNVDVQAIAAVVSDWTGIPVGRMVRNEIGNVLNLAPSLGQRVVGQDHAMEAIARRIQTSRAGLDNPSKPIGVFMLCGPSGTGKTETALALAESIYGGEHNVVTINMSEFQEAHTVSTLKGAPPGYVGYGEGGILTEAVRRKPYSVVLLDEVEKAHPDVHEIFFQVFDKGMMEDGEGRLINFKNTLILLTSNVGSDLIAKMCSDPELMPDPDGMAKALREPLLKVFPAALLGRLVVIPYFPLSATMLDRIIRLQLGRISKRVAGTHRVPFTFTDDVVKLIAQRCTEVESGGRMIDAILTGSVLPAVSREILTRTMDGRSLARIHVDASDGTLSYAYD